MVAIVSQIKSILGIVCFWHCVLFSFESTIYDWNKDVMSHTDSKQRWWVILITWKVLKRRFFSWEFHGRPFSEFWGPLYQSLTKASSEFRGRRFFQSSLDDLIRGPKFGLKTCWKSGEIVFCKLSGIQVISWNDLTLSNASILRIKYRFGTKALRH